jgi:hypothetical protein
VDPTDLAEEIVDALIATATIGRVLKSAYRLTDNPKDLVRVGDVARLVAERLEVDNSPTFRARVRVAAEHAGWKWLTTRGHVVRYRRMAPR